MKWWKRIIATLLVLLIIIDLSLIVASSTINFNLLNYQFYQKELDKGFYEGASELMSNYLFNALKGREDVKPPEELKQSLKEGLSPEFLKQEMEPEIIRTLRVIKSGKEQDFDLSGIAEKVAEVSIKNEAKEKIEQSKEQIKQNVLQSGLNSQINKSLIRLTKIHKIFSMAFIGSIALLFVLGALVVITVGANSSLKHGGSAFTTAGISILITLYVSKGFIPEMASAVMQTSTINVEPLRQFILTFISDMLLLPIILGWTVLAFGIIFYLMAFFVKDDDWYEKKMGRQGNQPQS